MPRWGGGEDEGAASASHAVIRARMAGEGGGVRAEVIWTVDGRDGERNAGRGGAKAWDGDGRNGG